MFAREKKRRSQKKNDLMCCWQKLLTKWIHVKDYVEENTAKSPKKKNFTIRKRNNCDYNMDISDQNYSQINE